MLRKKFFHDLSAFDETGYKKHTKLILVSFLSLSLSLSLSRMREMGTSHPDSSEILSMRGGI